MEPVEPRYLHDLSKQELHQLVFQTELYAAERIEWVRWRGDFGGVLPEGYDPATIVSQSLLELQVAQNNSTQPPVSVPELHHELRRIVRRQINRLYRLRENRIVRNEPDLTPALADVDDEFCSPTHLIPGPDPSPLDIALEKEDQQQLARYKETFLAHLGRQRQLKTLFSHICAGILDPRTLAKKLHLNLSAIRILKKRLARRIAVFQRRRASAKLESPP